MRKLIIPVVKATPFTILSFFRRRRIIAPARGIKMVVERIGKLRGFIIR
jgi:hypothetical protein